MLGVLQGQLEPDSSLKSRSISIHNLENFTRGDYRHSNTFNVAILAPQQWNDWNGVNFYIRVFSKLVVPSRTMLLVFFINPKWNFNSFIDFYRGKDYQVFAALKIMIRLHAALCDRSKTLFHLMCSGGCTSSSSKWTAHDLETDLRVQENLYEMHRFLFYKGNKKPMVAIANDPYHCLSSTNTKLNVGSKSKSWTCGANLITILTITTKHNFTVSIYNLTRRNLYTYRANYKYQGPELIVGVDRVIDHFTNTLSDQLAFGNFDSKTIHYCTLLDESNEVWLSPDVWILPFTRQIWMAILVIVLVFTLYTYVKQYQLEKILVKHLHCFAIVLGQYECARFLFFIVYLSLGFLLTQIYGNGFTSIITVATPIKGFQFVEQLINRNYSIVFNPLVNKYSLQTMYGKDMQLLGLSVENAFTVRELAHLDILDEIADKNRQLAMISDTSTSKYIRAFSMNRINQRSNSAFTCFTVDQTILLKLYYWTFKIESQYWVKSTLRHIVASGLYSKWDEWAEWNVMMREKLMNQHFAATSDVVNRSNFLVPVLCSAIMLGVSFLIFSIKLKFYNVFKLVNWIQSRKFYPQSFLIRLRRNILRS
ncbi:unnamed protein product [Orchesella dallaii]|uniref:Uncharacterized protein n=1 Tax=Orchesella dallaii TaxID=48710 RepID=A0ABP1RQY3_9HEXA